MPTLASSSFGKRGLILIIFSRQHQHTLKDDVRIQLSSSVHFYTTLFHHKYDMVVEKHFYLLHFLLESCDGTMYFPRWTVGGSEKSRLCKVLALEPVSV